MQDRLDKLNTVMQENLAGVSAMQLALVMPFMILTVNFGVVGAIWFGGILENMKIGQVMAFVNYLLQTLFSLSRRC